MEPRHRLHKSFGRVPKLLRGTRLAAAVGQSEHGLFRQVVYGCFRASRAIDSAVCVEKTAPDSCEFHV